MTTPVSTVDDSNVAKTDNFPTVASHDHTSSATSVTFATKVTTPTAKPVDHDGVIIVRERQQRRRLAVHPRRRAHKSERTRIVYEYVAPSVTKTEKVVMSVTPAVPAETTTLSVSGSKEGVKV